MEKNLFQQAKDMMTSFLANSPGHEGHQHTEQEKEAVRKAIQAAYNEATPEEKTQLQHFEQQLEEKIKLH
ncbi:DUF3813 domain-containing protein [Pseudogracilibacillus auburnensis]|uniref:DUF3813 domain-containing protein n=1 Tax=Pseudogracilibacillus auburnensis TaxID=1494959 RepID=UPI001A960CF0|nr:DUF3813 domain-containing protein [Pseudogracilibacillus auburnensis]MBO1003622.1 DUF3813 domain-containing protein [Pseudogracilibacillus auburnensis]